MKTGIENIEIFAETGIELASTGIESGITGIENIVTGIELAEQELESALSDTERRVARLILKNPKITQDRIAEIIGMSKSGIRYVMDKLKDRGILVRVGSTKKGKWSIPGR